MKTYVISLVFLIISITAFCQLSWQNTFYSGQLPDGSRVIQTQAENGNLVLLSKNEQSIESTPMLPADDGYGSHLLMLQEPAYPYIGFSYDSSDLKEVLPVYYNGLTMPATGDLTQLLSDPTGDANFTNTYLDITDSYGAFSETKLYFAIRNNGGGFPTGSGLTYFAYLIALVNPEADSTANTIVFGLMHTVSITGVITPGLYKIFGTGISDMTLIGQINTSIIPEDNMLILSCNISDLLADADFSSWFNPENPRIGFMALTNRISLTSGNQTADQTASCNLIPFPVQISQAEATIPILSDILAEEIPGGQFRVSLGYLSQEAYLPVTAQLTFDNGFTTDFDYTAFPDFAGTVHYEAHADMADIAGWNYATLMFSSDNQNYTSNVIYNTHSSDTTAGGYIHTAQPQIYPNPTNGMVKITFSDGKLPVSIDLYDVRGRRISSRPVQPTEKTMVINLADTDSAYISGGIGLIRFVYSDCTIVKKILFRH
jgi:hypothetical protein